MELLFNDLSLHGQFGELRSFEASLTTLMQIREIARQYGRAVPCLRSINQAQVTSSVRLFQVLDRLSLDRRRAILQWLARDGPFWDDNRHHTSDEWYEFRGTIVTDTALGEAAWGSIHRIDTRLVSLSPSNWEIAPITIDEVQSSGSRMETSVENYWSTATIENALKSAPIPISSWHELREVSLARCGHLQIAADAFEPIGGHPFVFSAAQRILFILVTLNRLKQCFDASGQWTQEGHFIYRDYFTGKKGSGGRGALFSDSSDKEKSDFTKEMTFNHPSKNNTKIFCPWHGKIQTPQMRVHFTHPIRHDEPLAIVYIGPKITKR